MKVRRAVAAAALASVAVGFGLPLAAAAGSPPAEAEARQVVRQFFQTLNARQFARTCDLMSTSFYRANHVRSKRRCILGLTVTFAMTAAVHFRIVGVRSDHDQAVVRGVANGAPGALVLVREAGRLRILSVGSTDASRS